MTNNAIAAVDEQQALVDRLATPRRGQSYPIRLGASFKSEAVGVGTHIHTVAYSFRPASTDLLQPAAMRVDANESSAQLEFHNRRADAPSSICLVGKHSAASKRECILIFDEGEQCFVLEKIASTCRDVKKAPQPFEPTLLGPLNRGNRKRTISTATAASSTVATSSPQKSQAIASTATVAAATSDATQQVRLNASSANDVKLTMSSQINRFLDEDDDDDKEESSSEQVEWNL